MRKSVDYMKHELFPNLIAHRRDPSHIIRLACTSWRAFHSRLSAREADLHDEHSLPPEKIFRAPASLRGMFPLSFIFRCARMFAVCAITIRTDDSRGKQNWKYSTKNQHLLRKTRTPSLMTVSPFEVGIQSCFERRVWKSERG